MKNKDFAQSFFSFFQNNKSFLTKEDVEYLASSHDFGNYTVLKESHGSPDEEYKEDGYQRYYKEFLLDLYGKKFLVSQQWYSRQSPYNLQKFAEWLIKKAKEKNFPKDKIPSEFFEGMNLPKGEAVERDNDNENVINESQNDNSQSKKLVHQKIFFGAPGTGKSFTLKTQSSPFEDQKKIRKDKKDEIRNAIAEAITKSGKLTLLNSIGFKYSDELKNIQRKDLPSYCEYDKIDELYIGSNAKPISETIQITKDDQLSDIDFIKDLIQNKRGNNNSLKWANAIGFKFGDFLKDWTLDELRKTFELSEPQMWWIYRGAQASQIRSSEIETEIKYVERVTFHPNYSYAQFVGTYKPVQDNDDKKQIKYEYVPGPFMRMYCSAKKNPNNDFLLIIEEINRANVAAVFGDVFQLLDRKKGVSEYPVAASEDVRNYLADNGINDKELCIPNNMYIWATMNSADQGVFPMDTAFKRRWEFEYIGIDENEDGIKVYDIPLQKNTDGSHEWIKWNDLRHSINNKLTEMKINEDKLLGPYFISEEKLKLVEGKNEENAAEFVKSFKSKVLMYLFEDAVKMRPGDLFDESAIGRLRFSDICQKFDEIGQDIFNFKK